jgi:metal-responsive CopG/Arc/MetJ family transcriptional regulator
MAHISVKVPADLHKALTKKSKELGNLKLSDTVRILLRSALSESENRDVKNGDEILKAAEKICK